MNHDDRYVNEEYQVLPAEGYHRFFLNMSDHPRINIFLNSPMTTRHFSQLQSQCDALLYTGPLDLYFDYCYGHLGYRSLRFEWKEKEGPFAQPCVQINYPNDFDYTRTVEMKHLSPQVPSTPSTMICYEYPQEKGDPFYPLLTQENQERFKRYQAKGELESQKTHPTFFLGRLAEYRYFNMDHVMLNALKMAEKIKVHLGR
jgi:UDP-galactopyranose mutase